MNDTLIQDFNNSTTTSNINSTIILYRDSIYELSSNSITDLSIFFIGLFLCLSTCLLSLIICCNSQLFSLIHYCSTKRDLSKLKKQKLPMKTELYYESIREYNGTSKYFANSQPILFVISALACLMWFVGSGLYYNLLTMKWLEESSEQVASVSNSRRIYCICVYIWLHYILGSYLYSITIFGRVLSLFVYNIKFGREERIATYRKKQIISISTIFILSIFVICIGVVISIFIKFNTNGSNLEMRAITCNRLNSVGGDDSSISQYDPNTIALVVLQYLLIALVFGFWCLSFFASSKTCCSKSVPNALLKRFDFYWNLVVLMMFFGVVTEFNVVSFLFGFQRGQSYESSTATLIESMPEAIRYTNMLAMPVMEIIALIGYNYQLIVTCLTCRWKAIKKFRIIDEIPDRELYEKENKSTSQSSKSLISNNSTSIHNNIMNNNSSSSGGGTSNHINLSNTASSLGGSFSTNNSRNSLLRSSMIAIELNDLNRHKYVQSPKKINSISLDDQEPPLPFHGLENAGGGSRRSLKSNRSSIKSSTNGSSTKRSESRVHFM